jgi:hypothetical protein
VGSEPGIEGTTPVVAAHSWASNADLIADVHRLGYLRDDDHVLDPTFGRGLWWKKWQPEKLTVHDLALDGVDFRALPYPDGMFDAVAFDPPYVSVGGRATTGLPDFHARYGLTGAPRTPAELQQLINAGLTEIQRVVKPGGVLLVKCQDYVSSGRLWVGTHWTLAHALTLGMEPVDRLEHIGRARPQPSGRRQVHARRNLSTLFVLR